MATQAPARSVEQRGAASPAVRLSGIRRTYGDVVAIDKLDLDIAEGEFFTLLGPSGSGKTTTLRVIAGFERADEGHVELALTEGLDDRDRVFVSDQLRRHVQAARQLAAEIRHHAGELARRLIGQREIGDHEDADAQRASRRESLGRVGRLGGVTFSFHGFLRC